MSLASKKASKRSVSSSSVRSAALWNVSSERCAPLHQMHATFSGLWRPVLNRTARLGQRYAPQVGLPLNSGHTPQ